MSKRPGRGILASIEALPDQVLAGWRAADAARFASKKKPTAVVVSGMGGSALGADVLQSAYADRLAVPFSIVNGYKLPHWVGRDTLVVLSSYSGTTEETLATAKEAKAKKARIAVLTAGGDLLKMAEREGWPIALIDKMTNPSNQPRMAIGSGAFALAGLLAKSGALKMGERDATELASFLRKTKTVAPAQDLADLSFGKMLLLIGAEHLTGAVHVFNNQVNENAKQLSTNLVLPEIDHHLLEGLSFPLPVKKNLLAVFFQSNLYHPQVAKRVALTAAAFIERGIESAVVSPEGKTRPEQAWQTIQFGSRVSLALAKHHRIDPEPVPNVERFKQSLA